MRSLTGLLSIVKILVLLSLFSLYPLSSIYSSEQIIEESEIYYTIQNEGETSFRYIITLSAQPEFATAISRYTLTFPFENLDFTSIKSGEKELSAHKETGNRSTQLILNLENRILNHASPITIELLGTIDKVPLKETELTRALILPGGISGIEATKIEIDYPKSWEEISNFNNEWIIQYSQDTINLKKFDSGGIINLIWGDKIAYNFEINKKLSNTLAEPKKNFDLNIPKAHHNQKVFFSQITPTPNFAYQDAEGNLFFSYELNPGAEINIHISGQILIDFSHNLQPEINVFEKPVLTETTGYWLLDNEYELNRLRISLLKEGIEHSNVKDMDLEKRQKFYQLAYKYVVERLQLANVRTTSMESNIRQGANNAVLNRTANAPEDFVDLLSAIYRGYGVPTRMIEGYVMVLEHGFYHSWLQFWDEDNGWQQADPALEAYFQGNFFKTELCNHTTILSRGYNYIRPRMNFFDNNEFQIEFADNISDENLSVENSTRINPLKKTEENVLGILTVKNIGNSIISMQKFLTQENIAFGNQNALQLIVPGQSIEIPFVYESEKSNHEEDILLKYTSINGSEILNAVDIDLQEQNFWWWNPLVNILKFLIISLIVYILYFISTKIALWVKRYYQ